MSKIDSIILDIELKREEIYNSSLANGINVATAIKISQELESSLHPNAHSE